MTTRTTTRVWIGVAAGAMIVAVASAIVAAPTFPEAPDPTPATFANVSGGVRVTLVFGETLYVGGNFRVAQNNVTRTNLAAFDLAGNLRPEFSATPNGRVLALATDGVSLFVGGEFTRLDLKKRLAAVDLVTGKVNRQFTAHVTGAMDVGSATAVRALAVMRDPSTQPPTTRLVVGGNFTGLDSNLSNRNGLGALYVDTGDLDAGRFTQGVWGGFVDALLPTGDAVYVGGSFTSVQGRSGSLAALGFTGALQTGTFRNGTQPIIDLDIDEATNRLFAASGGGNNRALAMTATGANRGQVLWRGPRVGGDVQSIHHVNGAVYFGFHDGLFVEPDPYKLAALDPSTGVLLSDADHSALPCSSGDAEVANCWLPVMDQSNGGQGFFGVWSLNHLTDPASGRPRLLVGGEFTQIGGVTNTRRFAIFRELPPAPPPDATPPVDAGGP